jgi:hypothetical protein
MAELGESRELPVHGPIHTHEVNATQGPKTQQIANRDEKQTHTTGRTRKTATPKQLMSRGALGELEGQQQAKTKVNKDRTSEIGKLHTEDRRKRDKRDKSDQRKEMQGEHELQMDKDMIMDVKREYTGTGFNRGKTASTITTLKSTDFTTRKKICELKIHNNNNNNNNNNNIVAAAGAKYDLHNYTPVAFTLTMYGHATVNTSGRYAHDKQCMIKDCEDP